LHMILMMLLLGVQVYLKNRMNHRENNFISGSQFQDAFGDLHTPVQDFAYDFDDAFAWCSSILEKSEESSKKRLHLRSYSYKIHLQVNFKMHLVISRHLFMILHMILMMLLLGVQVYLKNQKNHQENDFISGAIHTRSICKINFKIQLVISRHLFKILRMILIICSSTL
jgi:hypothetical protein